MGGDPCRVERVDVGGEAVDDGLLLRLEGAEEPVPHDQDAAVVAVEVLPVRPVVDPVVGRRVERALGPPDPVDRLRVDPELIDQIDSRAVATASGGTPIRQSRPYGSMVPRASATGWRRAVERL